MRAVSRGKQRLRADTMRTQCKAIGLMSRQSALQKNVPEEQPGHFFFFFSFKSCETSVRNGGKQRRVH